MRNFSIHAAALLLCAALSVSCRNSDIAAGEESPSVPLKVYGESLPSDNVLSEMNLFVSEELALRWESATGEDGFVDLDAVDAHLPSGTVQLRRLFPFAGEFEERTRREGLHRWYKVIYEEGHDMTRASAGLAFPGVEIIEYAPKISITGNPEAEYCPAEELIAAAAGADQPFNDPMLSQQWHYYNNGTAASSVSGCDINVFPVWKNYCTGNPEVIVSIVDGGVDFTHEDLADNMWINPEKKGNNRFGYNFVSDTYTVTADDHGTHVAGTIAAVNNNGIGVCGIAGGDKKSGQGGVKIMSCQIFEGKKSGSGSEAIKWGADHGAVISQNSWGYVDATTTPTSLKNAVDYFIQYAGTDKNGNQTGPMKGGLVIFAAGNENRDFSGNDYDKILNVASVGADYRRAYYSNFGSWVDVAAPGGDAKKGNQVLSTLPGNKYGRMQGTSMACPHVSGVAALLLSRLGGPGFTPDALRSRIEGNITDIASFNRSYYIGKGLVNAYKAMAGSGGKAPGTPSNLQVSASSNNLHISVKIPSDEDDGTPAAIYVYYSHSDFSTPDDALFAIFYTEGLKAGQTLTGVIPGLDFNTAYFVAARSCDLAGNFSQLTPRVHTITEGNHPPVITVIPTASAPTGTDIVIKPHESAWAEFSITEPDGHFYTLELEKGSDAAVLDTVKRDNPKVRITGANAASGTYTAILRVTDIYGLGTSTKIKYTILENHAPYIGETLPDRIFTSRSSGTVEMIASDYFKDDDGEDLNYDIEIGNTSVANLTYAGGKFYLTPINYGNTQIRITGKDIRGESISQAFRLLVRDGNREVEVYPNPVREYLYIRTGNDCQVSVMITGATGACIINQVMTCGPFQPAEIDLSSRTPGNYTVSISTEGGNSYKYNVIKI